MPLLLRPTLLCCFSILALLPSFARAQAPALLTEALLKSAQDESYWAYTETTREIDGKGKAGPETIVRFDPSKPYAEQFTPLKIDGKPPSARQLKEHRKRGEERGRELEAATSPASDPAAAASDSPASAPAATELENEGLDLARARVVAEDEQTVTYEIPLRRAGSGGPPPESFQLVVRLNKARRELENMTVRVIAPVRAMLVARLTGGEVRADYTIVDPQHPSVMTSFTGTFSGSFLFMKGQSTQEEKRTDFQRVKPYGNRFQVRLGPLRALL